MAYRFLRFPGGVGKAVTLSYDDGPVYDVQLAEIIDRHGLKCTFNLNSKWLHLERKIKVEQIKNFLDNGHEVAVHGAEHLANGLVDPIDGIRDVLECREVLESTFARIIRGMAYPDCGVNRFSPGIDYGTVRNYLKNLGIVYARVAGGDNDRFELPSDWLRWVPTVHHINPELMDYVDRFLNINVNAPYHADRHPRLFYLWGHSYEFNDMDNWDLLENVSAKLGGRDDIWYATNIEIYDYVTAYTSLIRSADGRRVYNPNVIPVWFTESGQTYCVNPGEELVI